MIKLRYNYYILKTKNHPSEKDLAQLFQNLKENKKAYELEETYLKEGKWKEIEEKIWDLSEYNVSHFIFRPLDLNKFLRARVEIAYTVMNESTDDIEKMVNKFSPKKEEYYSDDEIADNLDESLPHNEFRSKHKIDKDYFTNDLHNEFIKLFKEFGLDFIVEDLNTEDSNPSDREKKQKVYIKKIQYLVFQLNIDPTHDQNILFAPGIYHNVYSPRLYSEYIKLRDSSALGILVQKIKEDFGDNFKLVDIKNDSPFQAFVIEIDNFDENAFKKFDNLANAEKFQAVDVENIPLYTLLAFQVNFVTKSFIFWNFFYFYLGIITAIFVFANVDLSTAKEPEFANQALFATLILPVAGFFVGIAWSIYGYFYQSKFNQKQVELMKQKNYKEIYNIQQTALERFEKRKLPVGIIVTVISIAILGLLILI